MVRSILGVLAGIVAGGIVVYLVELPGYFIHPPPPNFNFNDPEAFKAHIAAAPPAAMLIVLLAWTIGSLVAAFIAALIARRSFLVHGLVAGAIFVVLDLINLVSYPHPMWMWAGGILAPLAMGYFGSLLAQRVVGSPPAGPQPQDMRSKNMAC